MDRRRFLAALGLGTAAAVAGAIFDPELALWVPGRKTYFLPTTHHNTLITPEWLDIDLARMVNNSLRFAERIDRHYDDGFVMGKGVHISLPLRWSASLS